MNDKCENCGINPAEALHPCPYDAELYEGDKMCNCCTDCTIECAMHI